MLSNKFFPYSSMQEINLDWILTKVKNLMRFLPDDGSVGQILRRTAHGAEWSNEQGGGGAVTSVNGQTGDVVLAIPDSTSDLINDSGFVDAAGAAAAAPVQKVNGQTGTVTINKTSVGLGNVQNVLQYSASNPPPYPVTSVNGQTGAVSLSIPTNTSDLNNDSGFVDAAGAAAAAPVQSVNGQTGTVVLTASDVGAMSGTDSGWLTLSNVCQYRKMGSLVFLSLGSDGVQSLTANTWFTVGTLPAGFRPADVITATLGGGNRYCQYLGTLYVYANGTVELVCSGTTNNWKTGVCYPV